MAIGVHLKIDRLTQYAYSGDDEKAADPDAIDAGKFTRVYVEGEVPTKALEYDLRKVTSAGLGRRTRSGRLRRVKGLVASYAVTIEHYSMDANSRYLLRVGLGLAKTPIVVASAELKTK